MAHTNSVTQVTATPQLIADAATFLRIQNRGPVQIRVLYAAALPDPLTEVGEDLRAGSVDVRTDLANRQLKCWAWLSIVGAHSAALSVERDQ